MDKVSEFLKNLALSSIQHDVIKHPLSGSDYTLYDLLSSFQEHIKNEKQ